MGKGRRRKAKGSDVTRGFLEAMADRLTANFQRELRHSELWDQMVAEFGAERAEELVRECQAQVRPGAAADASRDRPKDLA